MAMLPRHLKTLEFDKVLARLVRHTGFSASEALAEQLTPSTDLRAALRSQDATEEARRLLEARPNTGVRGAHDVRPNVRRAALGAPLQPAELLEVASTVASARSVRNLLSRQEVRTPTLGAMARGLPPLDHLENAIRGAIDDEGNILDGASDRLRMIRLDLRASYDRLMKRLNEMLTSSSIRDALQEPIITMRSGRYVLPIKADFRGRVRGIVHDQSASGATLFVEPLPVVDLTNKWRQHGIEEEHEIQRILLELSRLVGIEQYALASTVEALARIDLAFAMARLALDMEATRPALHDVDRRVTDGVVRLNAASHPLLRGDVAVPIDVELGRDFDVLLITGPNTGGKTIALKTVGLLALMAQAGLQVPAGEGSSLAMFSGVYADIGDEQSIEQSLSTFSSHVTRIVEILQVADRDSLVLLDEIGAGTDPQEGSVLSRAILQHLVEAQVPTIATSHYSELKTFVYATPRMENASVEFDPQTLQPTFHLTIGLPGRSNALTIAERLGMPRSITEAARAMTHPTERQADELLQEIHQQLAQAREERSEAARLRQGAERAAREARGRLNALQRDRQAVLQHAEDEGAATLGELRREADAIRRQLRGLKAERERLAAVEAQIDQLAAQRVNRHTEPSEGAGPPAVAIGDSVYVPTLDAIGAVIGLGADGGSAEVDVGGIRVRVPLADLAVAEEAPPSPRARAMAAGYLSGPSAPRRLTAEGWTPIESQVDLRGLTTEEARYQLDRYLNDAYMDGLRTVRIIHGKGTGAVRQAVRDLLADHALVRAHETAEQREGGEGATVAHLAT